MTTILITPTHMASDHTVVYQTKPHRTVVDRQHRKIFIEENNHFMFATSGCFDPELLDNKGVHAAVEIILRAGIEVFDGTGAPNGLLGNDDLAIRAYRKVFDKGGHTFVVTSRHRFVIYYSDVRKQYCTKACGEIAGYGSGGDFAVGLLKGGIPIDAIWEPLHEIDRLTSVEHTIVSLGILKPEEEWL